MMHGSSKSPMGVIRFIGLHGYRTVQLNSLTVAAYSALKLTSLTSYNHYGVSVRRKNLGGHAAAAAENFGWLGGAPSVFRRRRRRMIPTLGG